MLDEDELTGSNANLHSLTSDAPAPSRENLEPPIGWKAEITERVRAHRSRSSRVPANQPSLPGMEDALSPSSVAARVAERYARLPSYREMLEAQAAAAKAAVDSLVAAAGTPPPFADECPQPAADYDPPQSEPRPAPEPYQPELLRYSVSMRFLPTPRFVPVQARPEPPASAQRTSASQDCRTPWKKPSSNRRQPLPARLVTSPRELVAPRKARPRLAEGPLRDDPRASAPEAATATHTPPFAEPDQPMAHSPAGGTDLRVTDLRTPEVGRESAPSGPSPSTETPPAWPSIHLDTETPMREPKPSSSLLQGSRLHVASLEDRIVAALVDCALTLCAFLLFSLVFAVSSTSLPSRPRRPHRRRSGPLRHVAHLPAPVFQPYRRDPRHALCQNRPLHLWRRKSHPLRPPRPHRCPVALSPASRTRLSLGRFRRGCPRLARPHYPDLPTQLPQILIQTPFPAAPLHDF